MILHRLVEYYDRLAATGDDTIPRFGYSSEKISFALELSPEGLLTGVYDLRHRVKTKHLPRLLVVPTIGKPRTSGVLPMPLWDKTSYVLGADNTAKPEKAAQHFAAFRAFHEDLLAKCEAPAARALLAFLRAWRPEQTEQTLSASVPWAEVSGTNLVFRMQGSPTYLHEDPEIRSVWTHFSAAADGDVVTGQCLVSGTVGPIARTHPTIGGVIDAQSSGAALVSFNDNAYCSYGLNAKDQSLNAPVSTAAAFAYTTALNHLLRGGEDNKQKITLADSSVVFWSQDPCELEEGIGPLVANPDTDGALYRALQHIAAGVPPREALKQQDIAVDDGVRFYVLALAAPGKARLTVRTWWETTLSALLTALGDHYRAMAIEPMREGPPDAFGLWRCLCDLAQESKRENVPGPLTQGFLRAVLSGTPYPDTVLSLALGRIRHDHSDRERVTPLRAGLIKAFLSRNLKQEITVSLNPQETDTAYCLGRLFAVLEKAQKDALPGIKATIRDRYFAAASATPAAVFPVLLRLAQHHIAKDEYGSTKDRQIAEILDRLNGATSLPARLPLAGQGRFAVGYYHQRTALYRKSETSVQTEGDSEE